MRLSTSSSNDRLPNDQWPKVWIIVIIICLLFIGFFEIKLRYLGWRPSVVDSKELWAHTRKKASSLGNKAVILVGTSRTQLDLDLEVVKEKLHLQPVQLAIDGSPFFQVLENLANDESIKGTVILSITIPTLMTQKRSRASEWVEYYENNLIKEVPYKVIHNKISMLFDKIMVTRLEGAKPSTVIINLAFQQKNLGNYLITYDDRSREADYQKVQMPQFYAMRLQRHYGKKLVKKPVSFQQYFKIYQQAIETKKTKSVNDQRFLQGIESLKKLVSKIEARGGRVFLVRYPSGKLLWEYDNRSFPRERFWNILEQNFSNTIHFADYRSLNQFDLPDGSHLDYRDKKKFTKSLMSIINEKQG